MECYKAGGNALPFPSNGQEKKASPSFESVAFILFAIAVRINPPAPTNVSGVTWSEVGGESTPRTISWA
jgi:hypothetical protein